MIIERVGSYKVKLVKSDNLKSNTAYETAGEAFTNIGLAGIAIEILANQNPGLLVNAVIASSILFGAAIYSLPEYKSNFKT